MAQWTAYRTAYGGEPNANLRAQLNKLGGFEDGPNEFMIPKGKVSEAGMEYVRKLRDVKYNETLFDILARQFEVAKLDEAKEGSLLQVVDPAIPPDKRSFPKRGLIVIGATVVGFFLGVFIALFQAGWERLESDAEATVKLHLLRRTISRKNNEPLDRSRFFFCTQSLVRSRIARYVRVVEGI